jgi:hypothetical protein
MERRDNDKTKQAYYDALVRFEWISKELGPESPAKVEAKARKVRAAAVAALRQLTTLIGKAKDLK